MRTIAMTGSVAASELHLYLDSASELTLQQPIPKSFSRSQLSKLNFVHGGA